MTIHAERVRPPAPGDCHPRFERQREDLVRWLDETRDVHRLFLEVAGDTFMNFEYTEVTVTRRKVVAWAPFVGRPFRYWWHVGVDSEGNGISGTNVRRWDIEYGPLFMAWLDGEEVESDGR